MSDTVRINTIDETQLTNGYVTVETTCTISGTPYDQEFVVNATDPVGVAAGVQQQAEAFKTQVAAAVATGVALTSLSALIGDTITL